MLTACGIETDSYHALYAQLSGRCNSAYRLRYWNVRCRQSLTSTSTLVATVLTACGIETSRYSTQYFETVIVATVLTACGIETWDLSITFPYSSLSCNSAYRLRYWNSAPMSWYSHLGIRLRCNSAYRLRYWNLVDDKTRGRYRIAVATVLTACGIET